MPKVRAGSAMIDVAKGVILPPTQRGKSWRLADIEAAVVEKDGLVNKPCDAPAAFAP